MVRSLVEIKWWSRQDFLDHVGFLDAGEFVVEAAVEVGQVMRIEAGQVQDRGVQVADVAAVDDRFVAELVGLAITGPPLHAAARHPVEEALRVMVAAAVLPL